MKGSHSALQAKYFNKYVLHYLVSIDLKRTIMKHVCTQNYIYILTIQTVDHWSNQLLIQEDIRLQWQMYIPWNFYSMLYQYWVCGIQSGRFPFPFFPVLVLAWLYRNKAKLDKGSIPLKAWEITCQPYKARNISHGGALTIICLFISVNYAWFTLVWQ